MTGYEFAIGFTAQVTALSRTAYRSENHLDMQLELFLHIKLIIEHLILVYLPISGSIYVSGPCYCPVMTTL